MGKRSLILPSSDIEPFPSSREIGWAVPSWLQARRNLSPSFLYTIFIRVLSVNNPSLNREEGTCIRRSNRLRSDPSSWLSVLFNSSSLRSVLRQKSTRVDLPVPRPPMIVFNQGLRNMVVGDPCPMSLASCTVMLSMAIAECLLGCSVVSPVEGFSDDFPSSNARRSPSRFGLVILIQVNRRPSTLKS